jgi:hypothetical protein
VLFGGVGREGGVSARGHRNVVSGLPQRTQRNVEKSDATVWFGEMDTPGQMGTIHACRIAGKPFEAVIGA